MKKEQLIERLIDTFTGMGSEDPADIATCKKIDIDHARMYLSELRANEDAAELTPDERVPAEVTPKLYMEAFNCYVEKCRHDYMKGEFIEWMKNVEPWDVYESYCEVNKLALSVIYTDWLLEDIEFPFTPDDLTMLDLIELGQHSPDFNHNQEFCWYEMKDNNPNCINNVLHSTDTPFADGIINAEEIAEWLLQDNEALDYVYHTHADTVPNCWPWED